MGGLGAALIGTLMSFMSTITYNIAASRFIVKLHPNKTHGHQNDAKDKIFCGNVSEIKKNEVPSEFTFLEILDNIIWMKWLTCWFKGTSKLKNS